MCDQSFATNMYTFSCFPVFHPHKQLVMLLGDDMVDELKIKLVIKSAR